MAVDVWEEKLEQAYRKAGIGGCLWPAPYDQDNLEAAMAFVRENRTWNESEREVQPMPDDLDYFWILGQDWFRAKEQGKVLHVLKARRMVVSWFFRILELHQMGLKREDSVIGGEKFLPACKHVWRLEFLYEDLRRRHPGWRLEESKHLQFQGDRALQRFALPNQSSCTAINGESTGVQGEGYSRITFEEFSLYPHAEAMLGQAKVIAQPSPDKVGGFIVTIANPEQNYEYWQIIGD